MAYIYYLSLAYQFYKSNMDLSEYIITQKSGITHFHDFTYYKNMIQIF